MANTQTQAGTTGPSQDPSRKENGKKSAVGCIAGLFVSGAMIMAAVWAVDRYKPVPEGPMKTDAGVDAGCSECKPAEIDKRKIAYHAKDDFDMKIGYCGDGKVQPELGETPETCGPDLINEFCKDKEPGEYEEAVIKHLRDDEKGRPIMAPRPYTIICEEEEPDAGPRYTGQVPTATPSSTATKTETKTPVKTGGMCPKWNTSVTQAWWKTVWGKVKGDAGKYYKALAGGADSKVYASGSAMVNGSGKATSVMVSISCKGSSCLSRGTGGPAVSVSNLTGNVGPQATAPCQVTLGTKRISATN